MKHYTITKTKEALYAGGSDTTETILFDSIESRDKTFNKLGAQSYFEGDYKIIFEKSELTSVNELSLSQLLSI